MGKGSDMKTVIDWFQRLRSKERRKVERIAHPRLVAYYWNGDKPTAHAVRDISTTGIYVLTEDRWYPRTLVRLTLQANTDGKGVPERSITVETMVVRVSGTGVGLMFLPQDEHHSGPGESRLANGADRKTLESFLEHISQAENAPAT
jgi:hypothetical protein